jgi:hypothetical protein
LFAIRSFLTGQDAKLNLISGGANGRITLWDPTSESRILSMYKLDDSIGKLNSLQAYYHDNHIRIAAGGTSVNNSGALNVYQIQ